MGNKNVIKAYRWKKRMQWIGGIAGFILISTTVLTHFYYSTDSFTQSILASAISQFVTFTVKILLVILAAIVLIAFSVCLKKFLNSKGIYLYLNPYNLKQFLKIGIGPYVERRGADRAQVCDNCGLQLRGEEIISGRELVLLGLQIRKQQTSRFDCEECREANSTEYTRRSEMAEGDHDG